MSEQVEHWIVCDGCGKEAAHKSTYYKALVEVIVDGWIEKKRIPPLHYCPECQRQGTVPADVVKEGVQ